jgi:hypothetical protein
MAISFSKLKNGQWGLRGTGIKIGVPSIVTKRDGSVSTAVASAILWTGEDGTQLASIASANKNGNTFTREREDRGYCDECGERPVQGTRCWETGLPH